MCVGSIPSYTTNPKNKSYEGTSSNRIANGIVLFAVHFKSEKMKKEFINYNQALRLKALGFDEPCFKSYGTDGLLNENDHEIYLSAPTFSQAFRWFREMYNVYAIILPSYADDKVVKNRFFYEIADGNKLKQELNYHSTYEEAELACLDKLIEIVESKSE